jgi:hypothetical protein
MKEETGTGISLLLSKSIKGASTSNVPIRLTNSYQKYCLQKKFTARFEI